MRGHGSGFESNDVRRPRRREPRPGCGKLGMVGLKSVGGKYIMFSTIGAFEWLESGSSLDLEIPNGIGPSGRVAFDSGLIPHRSCSTLHGYRCNYMSLQMLSVTNRRKAKANNASILSLYQTAAHHQTDPDD